jgi:hypothetical protein
MVDIVYRHASVARAQALDGMADDVDVDGRVSNRMSVVGLCTEDLQLSMEMSVRGWQRDSRLV